MSRKLKRHIEKTDVSEGYVYCSNEIVRVPWSITHAESKLLLIILHEIKSFSKNINESGKYIFYLNKADIFEKLGLSSVSRNHQYKKVASSLIMKTVFNVTSKDRKNNFCEPLIYDIKWQDYYPSIEVEINPFFMHFFETLESHYIKIPLKPALQLKSKKSLALFMFFCSYLNSNINHSLPWISQTDLKVLLEVPEDAYRVRGKPSSSAFRLKVIDPLVSEINNLNEYRVEYKVFYKENQYYYQFSVATTAERTDVVKEEKIENKEIKLYAG